MSNSWRQPAYLHKRSAVMERDSVDESVVKVPREIMPDCVLLLVRELYPNPVGVPYLDIRGGKGQLLVSSSCCLNYLLLS